MTLRLWTLFRVNHWSAFSSALFSLPRRITTVLNFYDNNWSSLALSTESMLSFEILKWEFCFNSHPHRKGFCNLNWPKAGHMIESIGDWLLCKKSCKMGKVHQQQTDIALACPFPVYLHLSSMSSEFQQEFHGHYVITPSHQVGQCQNQCFNWQYSAVRIYL